MFTLDNLQPSGKKRKRVGRGGSRGGTSGRGHKGQNARSGGGVNRAFEGGQMPISRRLPKRGFTNARFKQSVAIVDLSVIEKTFEENALITQLELAAKGLIRTKKSVQANQVPKIKILGNSLSKKLIICADAFSKSAQQAIKDCGGEAKLTKEM